VEIFVVAGVLLLEASGAVWKDLLLFKVGVSLQELSVSE
jgi:hypothetical protein